MTDLHDLVAPYVLDALDGDEARQFEAHLETCARCQAELADFGEGTAALAESVATPPPPELKAAVMAAIDEQELAPVVDLNSRRRLRLAWTVATAAAAIALVFFGLWTVANNQLSEADRIAAVYEAPDATLVELESANGPARFVYSPSLGQGVFNGGSLAAVDSDDVYQLWLIGDAVQSAGTLIAGDSAVLVEGVDPGLTLAMTVELAPGVDAPTSDPILAAEL